LLPPYLTFYTCGAGGASIFGGCGAGGALSIGRFLNNYKDIF